MIPSIETFPEYGTGGAAHRASKGSRNIPTANLMLDNQSLAIGVVKLNYTIRVFWSRIVLFGGSG